VIVIGQNHEVFCAINFAAKANDTIGYCKNWLTAL
jgi:hypothetical protein